MATIKMSYKKGAIKLPDDIYDGIEEFYKNKFDRSWELDDNESYVVSEENGEDIIDVVIKFRVLKEKK